MNNTRVAKRPAETTVRDPRSLTRLLPMMFVTALFIIIATAHLLATVKIAARDRTITIEDGAARQIRLIEAIAENTYFGVGYFVLCLFLIWFSAIRRYPLWAGWAIFISLVMPWLIYLKACGLIIRNVVTG